MFALSGVRRDYAWGSRSAIPEFLREAPTSKPIAELWFGAHPSGPSPIEGEASTLADLIASDPHGILGEWVVEEFGDELPFLFKLIAPAAPLSMQVHPSRSQARAGLAREGRDGSELYVDANHKPELLLPFIDFEVLAGLRSAEEARHVLNGLDHPLIAEAAGLMATSGVGEAFAHVLTHADAQAVEEVVALCAARRGEPDELTAQADAIVARLQEAFPGDRGVVASLMLQVRTLPPGEAMFVPTGTVHAYLSGLGAEIMANSDNVLRAGLTPKHVDVAELLRVIDPESHPTIFHPPTSDQITRYPTPIRDFDLSFITARRVPARVATEGPRIVMALDDGVHLTVQSPLADSAAHLVLERGDAAFIAHSEGAVMIAGGRVLHAGVAPRAESD